MEVIVSDKKTRLDKHMANIGLVQSRSQAENLIKLGLVKLNNKIITKSSEPVSDKDTIELTEQDIYVSRAGNKLASIAKILSLDFTDKVVLDVGSSTGGFTDFALKNGAAKVACVDVGTDQLHPSLRSDIRIELNEKTDIRDYHTAQKFDIVVIDVSFISLRYILPAVAKLSTVNTQVVAMLKPQFEAGKGQTNKGIVKNNSIRRQVIQEFETWVKKSYVIIEKVDSKVAGTNGNVERFYCLKKIKH
jgi:23S rRNA (cytidine1920-2'-O)/16S rRNA (cytidine1409-2'-O)-methyltransferase